MTDRALYYWKTMTRKHSVKRNFYVNLRKNDKLKNDVSFVFDDTENARLYDGIVGEIGELEDKKHLRGGRVWDALEKG